MGVLPSPIVADAAVWADLGCTTEVIDTVFEFESTAGARRLLSAYFGDRVPPVPLFTLTSRVGVFSRPSRRQPSPLPSQR